jgi:hypothetical protein
MPAPAGPNEMIDACGSDKRLYHLSHFFALLASQAQSIQPQADEQARRQERGKLIYV